MITDRRLQSITDRLRHGFTGLADITVAAQVPFENATYGRLYLKPGYKLGSALLTSRELLVVIADFHNIDARTIKFTETQLREAAGRLESGMAVIVHRDPSGDERLKSWGRERGITILPVNFCSEVPQGEDLEQTLCSALYSHDPFDLTGPVRAAHQFFGRSHVADVARRLRDGHIQALFGIRKIGKTSVLNKLLDEARTYHRVASVMVDCSDDSVSALTAGGLIKSISGAIGDALADDAEHYALVAPVGDDVIAAEAARVLTYIATQADRPIVIFIDEFDYISPSSPTAPHWQADFNVFFRALRQVYQECCRQDAALSVVISGVSSYWFSVASIDGIENAALAFVPESYVPPLERAESVNMVATLGRSAGLIFTAEAAAVIAAACSDIPFWMRRAGSFINSCYGQGDRPTNVAISDCHELCSEFVEVEGGQLAYSSLSHLFGIYPELGPAAISCLPGGDSRRVSQQLLSVLGRYGILGQDVMPSGPMVAAGLSRWAEDQRRVAPQLPMPEHQQPRDAIAPGSPSAAGEAEWADLLSEVSQLRNTLERQLREFVAVVVRAECKARGDCKPIEVLLAAIPSDRRGELAGKGTGAALKTLYWTELIAVMKKNWPWFQDVFGDRSQLELQASIINDRPDAHAKDFDAAELALQRRAIKWLQDRIDSSGVL